MSPVADSPKTIECRALTVTPAMYSPGAQTWNDAVWPKQRDFHRSSAKYRLQVGGFGCLAAGTIIAHGIAVENWMGGLVGQRYAGPAFLKGIAALYRVTTQSGKQVSVTAEHRFLSPTGWCPLSRLAVGALIAADDSGHEVSEKRISAGFQARCSEAPHRRDGLPHPFQAAYLDRLQQLHRTGVCSNALEFYSLLSIENSLTRDLYLRASFAEILRESTDAAQPHMDRRTQEKDSLSESRLILRHLRDNEQRFQPAANDAASFRDLCSASVFPKTSHRSAASQCVQAKSCDVSQPNTDGPCEGETYPFELPLCADLSLHVPSDYRSSFWDEITEIVYIGKAEFYDLTVPGFAHYSAHGLWHHNSGKSKPLLWEGIFHCLEFPGAECIILRKTIPDLKRTVISKFLSDVPKTLYERYNETDHIVYFWPDPVTGRQSKLYFAACERDEDVNKYLSTEWLYIAFEELGEFSFAIWNAMTGRNRCTIPGSRPCMAGATNPFGVGWHWIKKLWVDKMPFQGMDAQLYKPEDYEYFHSTVEDNPILFADEEYVRGLEIDPRRDKVRWGKLDTVTGQYFDNWELKRHCRPESDFIFEPWQTYAIGWDYGFGHYAAILWLTKAILKPQQKYGWLAPRMVNVFTRELILHETTPADQARAIVAAIPRTEDGEGYLETVDSVHFSWERFNRTVSDFTVADEVGDLLSMSGLPRPTRSNTDRVAGWQKMYSLLNTDELFVLNTCPTLAEAIPLLVRDPVKLEDVIKPKGLSLNDDVADGARYAIAGTLLDAEDVPADVQEQRRLAQIKDPMARFTAAYKSWNQKQAAERRPQKPITVPTWASKLRQ
jgi:hypothetical protein